MSAALNLNKKLPPFGKDAISKLSNPRRHKNNIFFFIGELAWKKAKAFNSSQVVLCLPPDKNVEHYFWPVNGEQILMFDTSGLTFSIIEEVAYTLLAHQATKVTTVLFNNELLIFRQTKS